MKITKFDDKQSWLEARLTRITGSRLKDIIVKRGTAKKMGYYELIAEQLTIPEDGNELAMDRGTRLEEEAIAEFTKATGKLVNTDLVVWERDDNSRIAISPDGAIIEADEETIKEAIVVMAMGSREAVEAKCLASSKHLQAFLTQKIPNEYVDQSIQYFVVNNNLENLYFAFYDPRLVVKQFFYLKITRADVAVKVEQYLLEQSSTLSEVDAVVAELTKI